jgi:hypothetical protein
VVVKRVIFVTFGLIFALLMTLFPVSMVVGSSGESLGTGFEPYYSLAFHVYNETTLDPIEGALVEILFPNFTTAMSDLTNLFGNVSFMLPWGSYMYNVTAAGYLETLSDEFLLESDIIFQVGLWTSIPLPVFITTPMSGENFFWENQTLAGNVTDARIVGIMYNVSSARGEYFGFASVGNQSFSVNITLMEGYNVLAVTGLDEIGNAIGNDMVIAKLDRWRPATSVMSNLFNETPDTGKKDFYNDTKQKTHDIESKSQVDEDGRVTKCDLDYTDGEGNKVGDLHITYTYDNKGKITAVKLEFTDKDGNVIKIQNLQIPNVKTEKGRITWFKYDFFVGKEGVMIKIGDIEVTIEYDINTFAPKVVPKVVTKIFTDGNGNPVRKTVTKFEYKQKKIDKITVIVYGNPPNWAKIGDMHHYFYPGARPPNPSEVIIPTDEKDKEHPENKREIIYLYDEKGKLTGREFIQYDNWEVKRRWKEDLKTKSVSMETTFFDAYNNTLSMVNETYTSNVTYFGTGQTLTGAIVFSDVNDELAPPLPSLSIVQVTISGETDNRTEVFLTYDDYVNITSMLYPGSNTVTIMVMDEAGNIMMNSHILIAVPSIESSNIEGNRKDVYVEGESVHVYGSNLVSNAFYPIYVVQDVAWTEGMSIPARLPGTPTTVATNSTGQIPPTKIWTSSVAGKYDIIIDVNDDGFYNATIDALDNNDIDGAGFIVTKIPHSPIANFTESSETPRVYEPVYFDASPSLPGFDGDDECPITEYRWDFGDGTTGAGKTIKHVYYKPGDYVVTLTVYAPGIPPYIDPQYVGTNTTDTIQHVKQVLPVGGYSIPIDTYTTATPPTTYLAILTIIVAVFTAIRRKTHRKTR